MILPMAHVHFTNAKFTPLDLVLVLYCVFNNSVFQRHIIRESF